MKSKYSLVRVRATRRFFVPTILASAFVFALMGMKTVQAQTTRYWDQNGATAGFGAATGTWQTGTVSRWSTSSAGTATPGTSITTTTADPLNFGTDSTGGGLSTGSITVTGTVSAASLRFGSQTTGNVTLSGGTINLAAATTIHVGAGSTTVHNITSTITGAGTSLTKTGNTLQLSGNNSFTGQTIISSGTLILNNATVLGGNNPGVNGTSSISMAANTILQSNYAPNDLGITDSYVYAPINLSASGTNRFLIGAGSSTSPAESVRFNINGVISGTAGANVVLGNTTATRNNADSIIVLGAASTYNGNTTIQAGSDNNRINVIAGVDNALPATTVLGFDTVVGSGSGRTTQYDLNGKNQTLAGLDNGGTVASLRNIRVTNSNVGVLSTLTINNSANYVFGGFASGTTNTSAQISGAIALTKSGSGTFTLASGSGNAFTGPTKILGGILALGQSTSIQNSNVDTANSVTGDATSGLRTLVPTLTLGGLSGNKNFADVFTTTSGGYDTLTALTLNPGASVTNSYSGNLGDGAGGMTLTKAGAGTQVLTGSNSFTGATTISGGTLAVENGAVIGDTALVTIANTAGAKLQLNSNETIGNISGGGSTGGEVSLQGNTLTLAASTTSTFAGVISGASGSIALQGTGGLTLSNINTYSGSTAVTGGTLTLSGFGEINASSGISINGETAKFVHNSSVAMSPVVTLTQGTFTGSGVVDTVNVGAGGGIISNNNGVAGASLTVGTLTFNGAATINTFGSTTAPIVVTNLVTNASGLITINPTAAIWTPGTYDLISYGGGSIGGAGFGQFTLGSVPGLSPRQTKSLGDTGTAITLTVGADDVPYWVGEGDGKWNVASTNNWKLSSNNSNTTFLAGDNVLFNDNATAAGSIAVDIDVANVAPTSTTFDHSAKNYTLGSTAGFGISAGSLIKSGTGTLTITNANTYTGNTTINGGVLDLSTDGAQLYAGPTPVSAVVTVGTGGVLVVKNFGQGNTIGAGSPSLGNLNNAGGQVVVDGGTIRFNNETSARGRVINVGANGATLDVVNNSTYTWSTSPGTSIPFTGSGQTLTLTGDATSTGTINVVIGGANVSLLKTGAATWTLGGTNTYTGNTTISAGTLSMSANRIASSPTIFIGDGATWNSTAGLTLAAGQTVTGTGSTGSITTTSSTGLITTGSTTVSSSGTLNVTRLSFQGFGNQITGGNIVSGGTGSGQRGLLVGNGSSAELTITGGTLTTLGGNTNYDTIANTNAAGAPNATLTINGGSYINTASNGRLMLGNTGTLAGNATLTLTTGAATVNTLEYNLGSFVGNTGIVNLNGGTFTVGNIISTAGSSRIFNFNGGLFKASANLTLPATVTANVLDGGAVVDTNGFSTTFATPLLTNGLGGLTKNGLGTLTLSGANTYNGATAASSGTLRFSAPGSSTTNVTVATGAEAGAFVSSENGQWVNTGDFTLQNNAVALVDYGSIAASTTVAPISVTNFANGTTPGINLAGASVTSMAVGQTYPLVTWTTSGPVDGSAFNLRTHRLSGTFSVASNTLSLTITNNAIGAISWNAGNGVWDTAATNWADINAASTAYVDPLDTVIFGDAAGASGNPVITLSTAISPVAMSMNTAGRNYTVSGSGSIGGSGSLVLGASNQGSFTLATANNTYSGGTSVLGGTLVLGDSVNSLPDSGAVTVDGATSVLSLGSNSDTVGAVTLSNGASITGSGTLSGASYALQSGLVSANLGGTGTLAKSTSGVVVLSGANSFSGTVSMSGGDLVLANTAALASATSISQAGGNTTLVLATDTAFSTLPQITGGSNLTHTIVSDRATVGTGLTHQLGAMVYGAATFNYVAGVNVDSGTPGISFASATLTSGATGTTLLNPTTATFSIVGGVTSHGADNTRTLQLDGTGTGHSIGGVITQNISSPLSVTKSNTSTWTLSGLSETAAENYSGTTAINEGTLRLTNTNPALSGGLSFGATIGSTSVGTLDLTDVSASFGGSLIAQTSSNTPNNVLIAAGKTLTVGGLTMTNSVDAGVTRLTMTGGGSLVVNGPTMIVGSNSVGTNSSSEAHLDLSALSSFNATLSSNFVIQSAGDNSNSDPSSLTLSNTANTIISPAVRVGNSPTGSTHRLWLGKGSNAIQTDLLNVGAGSRDSGVIDFAETGGTVSLRDQAGTGRIAAMNMGPTTTQTTGYTTSSLVDFTGNTADVAIGTFSTAVGAKTAANTNQLIFDSGILDIRTVNMAVAKGDGASTNRITIGGGIVKLGGSEAFADAGTGTVTLATAGAGFLTINGGTVTSTADFQKGAGGTGTATVALNAGSLDMGGKNIGSSTDTVTFTVQAGTLSNVGEINGGAQWTKTGTGALTLAGTNLYSGVAAINGGSLAVTGSLNPLSSLTASGASITYSNAAPQSLSALTINSGLTTIVNANSGSTDVLNVGAITRNPGGVVNFPSSTATGNVVQTTTENTNGILGTWAFVGSDFAMNDGAGNIVAYTGYADVTRLNPGVIANDATANVRIVEGSGAPGNITLGASTTSVNTLLQSESGGTSNAVVDVESSTLLVNTVAVSAGAGSLTIGATPNSGTLSAATEGGELVLTNNSLTSPLTVNAVVADNFFGSALIKTGVGTVVLNGANTYTGTTTVYEGTLRLAGSLMSSTVAVQNGTLQSAGNLPITAAVTLSGTATLDLYGASQTITSVANVAGNTLTNSSTGDHVSTATAPGSPALTDALIVTNPVAANSLPMLVTDGASRKTQVVLNNTNSNQTGFLTNTANTFSGGVVLAHNASNGTRLLLNGTNNGVVGTGPVIIGQANTDKAGVYFSAINTFANDIVFNTALGTDRVGLRADAAVTLTGKITANLAAATFTSNSATAGHVTLTGQVTGASGLVLDITSSSAAATTFNVTLNNAGTPNNYAGDTVINLAAATGKSATLNLGAAEQIPHGATTGNVVINSNGTGAGTLHLGGFSETINGLSGNGVVEAGGSTPTLTLGANNASATFGGVIRNTTGTLSLVKTGSGTQTLSGVNTYTGSTTVSQGTLVLEGGSLASPVTVSAGASLGFTLGSPTTSTSTFDLSAGTIKITGSATLASYDLITSSAGITGTPQLDSPVAGYELKVEGNTLKLVQAGYASWAALNGASVNLNEDHDGDGVPNGVEYFLGGTSGNTTGHTALPGVINNSGTLSVTWVMGSGYAGVYGTDFTVETSDSLSGAWNTETLGGTVTVTGSNVTYTFPVPLGTKKFARLKVTGP